MRFFSRLSAELVLLVAREARNKTLTTSIEAHTYLRTGSTSLSGAKLSQHMIRVYSCLSRIGECR